MTVLPAGSALAFGFRALGRLGSVDGGLLLLRLLRLTRWSRAATSASKTFNAACKAGDSDVSRASSAFTSLRVASTEMESRVNRKSLAFVV